MRRAYIGIAFVFIATLMWGFSFVRTPISGLLPFGGLLCFAAGWVVLSTALRWRGRPALRALASVGTYLAAGFVWVFAWNTMLRFRDHTTLPEMTQPSNVLALVLTWPWQVVSWLADSFS